MQVQALDVQGGFDDATRQAIVLVPKIIYFLLILVVGIFVAKFVSKILTKILQRVGFDALVERGGVKQALSKSKYDAAAILGRIVYYFIFLLVLSAAFGIFGADNPVSQFLARIIAFLPNLFVAILVLVIAAGVAAAIKDLLGNALGGLSYGAALANAASLFIVAIGVFFALDQLQIAPLIVGGIFYAVLALIIIPPIIAFGVGGIDPARTAIVKLVGQGQEKAQEVAAAASGGSGDEGDEGSGSDGPAASPSVLPAATAARARATRTSATRTASPRTASPRTVSPRTTATRRTPPTGA